MGLLLVVALLAAVVGLIAGGRPSHIGRRPVRATPLLAGGVVLQLAPRLLSLDGSTGLTCVLVGYGLLLVFAAWNIRLVGMPVLAVGLLLNVGVIALNSGMPVRASAVLAADHDRDAGDLPALQFDAKRHLATNDDRLTTLGDALPVRPTREVVSFGDLIVAAGLANVIFRLLKPRGVTRRHRGRVRDLAVVTS